jgi:AcrR family transcriptional regulator
MPRAGLTPDRVVREAGDLADEGGLTALTLSALAGRLGVRQPSLYKHVNSLDGLRRGISLAAKQDLGDALRRAAVGRSGPDAVRAIATTYRSWVLEHPGRYAATVRAPQPDDEEDQRASAEVVSVVLAVLAAFDLDDDAAVDAARALRSAIHGFVSLEAAGGFGLPRDVDRSFEFLIDAVVAGLRR